MIISASRRTDIPAFYHEWFLNRLREGFLLTKNPYNHKVKKISLLPQDVDAIIFWTRNPGKLIPEIKQLSDFNYYFQYTITGYPKILDAHGPNPYKSISIFKDLSNLIGLKKVIWRYDPIILSSVTPLSEHVRLFEKIASSLAGYTEKVVISFADLYKKTEKNLNLIPDFSYRDITHCKEEISELCFSLSNIAHHYDMRISTCAESLNLETFGIEKGKCIDDKLLNELFGINLGSKKDPGQRELCGCIKSIDIGQYNTCLHGCRYCYATFSDKMVKANFKNHNPQSPFLIGDDIDSHYSSHNEIIVQQKLF